MSIVSKFQSQLNLADNNQKSTYMNNDHPCAGREFKSSPELDELIYNAKNVFDTVAPYLNNSTEQEDNQARRFEQERLEYIYNNAPQELDTYIRNNLDTDEYNSYIDSKINDDIEYKTTRYCQQYTKMKSFVDSMDSIDTSSRYKSMKSYLSYLKNVLNDGMADTNNQIKIGKIKESRIADRFVQHNMESIRFFKYMNRLFILVIIVFFIIFLLYFFMRGYFNTIANIKQTAKVFIPLFVCFVLLVGIYIYYSEESIIQLRKSSSSIKKPEVTKNKNTERSE